MSKSYIIWFLFLIGCSVGHPQDVQSPVSANGLQSSPIVTNPCAYTDAELGELVRYERVIRQGFEVDDTEVIDRLLLSKRRYMDERVQKRCTQYKDFTAELDIAKAQANRTRVQESWEAKSSYIPQPRAGAAPLPQTPVENGSFWCRNLTDECLATAEVCETFGEDLFECHTVPKASCALYKSSMGDEIGCFANTETCNTFCGGREEGFNGKFACTTKCRTLSNENSYTPVSPSYRVSNEPGF